MKTTFLKQWCVFLAALLLSFSVFAKGPSDSGVGDIAADTLPLEAQQTLALIKQGGPYPYAKDGVVFGNYEGVLPRQKRGYYHEFTVKTPKARNRGARRIISGGNPQTSGEYYYTKDHYQTFQRIRE
ncbi:ribonuclease domain-containing protein [Herbaspirillum rhizosphaerae]|uniref:ribonuclease domain-containing protein n=1 Tax=Herbaspirillum rhizosphaerae TaxID=346179 RepID=UPI00067A9711|nr:ribonuclease [Herbaspirillum rhizosphaerae]